MPVMLTPAEMANVTGGVWENLTSELRIEEVEYIYHYLKPGDLFVVFKNRWHKIDDAVRKGVAALILETRCPYEGDPGVPVLRVERAYTALRRIALASSEKSEARRVLVTGSYGKTGFKNHLATVAEEDIVTYARRSSANHVESTYCNLASLRPEHELLVIEQPVSTATKTARRASYVKPDICVITSIGHEHIERFGTVERIAVNKTHIAEALKPGGKFLIPRDDEHYPLLKRELRRYDHIDVLTFGTRSGCNARLLYKRYREFGWDVIAKIEDTVVAYRVPFPEAHEPVASLAVLLAAYHLGVDVRKAAERFPRCENFKSSGVFYEVEAEGKRFFLYDQSYRGGIEGYADFFRTLRTVKPPRGGKKILMTSEFVDYPDGEMAYIDYDMFRYLIDEAEFDAVFSIEKFSEHFGVLPDCTKWRRHSIAWENIAREVLESIEENDMLCVKAIFESRMPEFVAWLKKRAAKMVPVKNTEAPLGWQEALHGLRPLRIADMSRYYEAVETARKRGWVAYFPFLITWGASKSREVLIADDEGAISIYLLRKFRRQEPPSLELLMPPMPLNETSLRRALARLFAYNGNEHATILWAEAHEKEMLEAMDLPWDLRIQDRETDEYLYDPSRYDTLAGTKFRHLRKDVSSIEALPNVEVCDYDISMREECLALLEAWEEKQGVKYGRLEDGTYTRNTLAMYEAFGREELFGIVVKIDGAIRSFGFAGKITSTTGSFYIGKSDLAVKGLHAYMRVALLRRMRSYETVNDSYALGEGMAFSKRMFRPVGMLKQYRVDVVARYRVQRLKEKDYVAVEEFNRRFESSCRLQSKQIRFFLEKGWVYGIRDENDRDRLFGVVAVKWSAKGLRIYQLTVGKAWRRQGMGRTLLHRMIILAKRCRCPRVYLEVETSNRAAIRLYKTFGFRKTAYLESYYGKAKSGYRMELVL